MRFLLLSPLPPARDGIADYTARLAAAYQVAGHAVAVVTAVRQVDPAWTPVLGALSWSPLRLLRVLQAIRRWAPDAVQVQHGIATYGARLLPLWILVLATRLVGIPVVITHHEVTRDVDRLGLAGRLYYRVVSTRADVVHVHTEQAKDVLIEQLGISPWRVLVSPHPVYELPSSDVTGPELLARHDLCGRRVLLQFGFVHIEKGLRELVDGLARLASRDPAVRERVRLVVAGDVRPRSAAFARFEAADRAYLEDVRRRAADGGVAGLIVFTGHVPDGEVAGWFAAADVVVLPYTHSEQSGVANLAIAAGVPVLASRTGGLGTLFAGALPTFAALDPESIADALAGYLERASAMPDLTEHYGDLTRAASPAGLARSICQRLGRPDPLDEAA